MHLRSDLVDGTGCGKLTRMPRYLYYRPCIRYRGPTTTLKAMITARGLYEWGDYYKYWPLYHYYPCAARCMYPLLAINHSSDSELGTLIEHVNMYIRMYNKWCVCLQRFPQLSILLVGWMKKPDFTEDDIGGQLQSGDKDRWTAESNQLFSSDRCCG
jgi:hypothetical protein